MISGNNLSMRYGGKILFKDASFQLLPKQKYGLVGPNGCGKSTLLKILAGDLQPESGDISMPSQQTLGCLKQDHFLYESTDIRDVVLMGKPRLWEAIQSKEKLLEKSHFTEQECVALAHFEKIIEEQHGYAAHSNAAQILEGLGIATRYHQQPMRVLSGGYKLRVLLGQLLFSSPDVLLLDEPTNHLDIFSIRWLEEYLSNFEGMVLLSSHDRHFLNAVCSHIVDIDYASITIYKGNYDAFEARKSEERLFKEIVQAKQEKRIEELTEFADRFKAKATKARQAQSRLKMAEKIEESMEDLQTSSRRSPHFNLALCRPSGAIALKVNNIEKSYGDKQVLHDVSFEVERGEKVAFVGPNGIGKSSLLEILTNHRDADNGSYEWGFAVETGYFPQDHMREVNGKENILDWLSNANPLTPREGLQKILGQVLFSGDDVKKSVAVLSGGEIARLIMAKIMLIKHNVLIFDEPTNHLDMESIEALLEALQSYPGSILFVSHNRYFVEKLATRVIEMTTAGVRDFKCSYPEYVEKTNNDHLLAKARSTPKSNEKQEASKQAYLDQKKSQRQKDQWQKKVDATEKKCHDLEVAIQEADAVLCSAGFYQNNSKAQQEKALLHKAKLEQDLQKAYAEWEIASEALSGISHH